MAGSDSEEGKAVPYFRQLHLELLAVLVVVFVVLMIVGWHLRPQSGGFPPIDDGLGVSYTGPQLTGQQQTILLTPGGGSTLEVNGNSVGKATDSWRIAISGLVGGRFCGSDLAGQSIHPSAPSTTGIVLHGTGDAFGLKLCWPTGGVADLNGAYLSAAFPFLLQNGSGFVVTYSPIYSLFGANQSGNDRDWSFQSQAPTSRAQMGWTWESGMNSDFPYFSVAAVNTNTSQHDSDLSFFSGVIFGVAAGALISVLTELVAPFTRRRDDRTDRAFSRTR
jgi:hypothetical protein